METEATPEQICRAALLACGVPEDVVRSIPVGRKLDYWVHYVVVENMPWPQAQARLTN